MLELECSLCLLFSLADDDNGGEASTDPDDAEVDNDPSFGKMFLVPRVKMSSYDLGIYTPELLQAREKVGAGSALSIVQVGDVQYSARRYAVSKRRGMIRRV